MRNKTCWAVAAFALLALAASQIRALGDTEEAVDQYKSSAFFAPSSSPDFLKYAPDRDVQMLHLALDLTPDFSRRTIQGAATLRFKPLVNPVAEIKLDAVELSVDSVTSSEAIEAWQSTTDKLVITFAAQIPPDKEASVTVLYHAEPTRGIYFRTPEMGYKPGDTHLFSQGEEIESRHWYPCFDSPNEKFTSEVTCRVPDGMTVISNGRLVSQDRDPATGLTAFHWSQEQPHANYLISLIAGYFKSLKDKHNEVDLGFFTPPSEFNEASNSFRDTRDIMAFYEQEIGLPYPWPKYCQTCVNDFVAGGMENTSATTLTDSTLFSAATENIRDSDGLIAHEMAHQWFGDLVTCKDWASIWLNEGFATYYQVLYDGHKNGHDSMLLSLYNNARTVFGVTDDKNPIVRRDYDDPGDMFNYLAYPKGAWVLHMLRSQLGPDLYRRCIKTYLERHRYGNVTSEDLRSVIEELSGRSFDQFFNQWLYHAHYPELQADYAWDEKSKLAKLTLRQTQTLGDKVLLFNTPLTIRFKGKFGSVDRAVELRTQSEDFYFPLDSAPDIVRLDPEYTLLAKITFNLPTPMLAAQLADPTDMMGRFFAVQQFGEKRDKESVARLAHTLASDPFYGVRVEAARILRSVHTDEALDGLVAATNQPDARVRLEVMTAVRGFYSEAACSFARKTLDTGKNPAILSQALLSLSGYAKPGVRETLVKYLDSQSFQNELANAAILALRNEDDPAAVAPLEDALKRREADLTSYGFRDGLRALAYLDRNEENKDAVEEFLLGYVNSRKLTIRLSAIAALGTLGDPRAISALEKFATASDLAPEHSAAETAVSDLRAARRPVDDFKNLRQEVLDLEKENRALRKELDELKQQFEAAKPPPTKSGKKPPAAAHQPAPQRNL
jgi:aminopeptidase N